MLALAGAAWLLYGPVLRLWWTYDDFFHLRYLITHRPFWYFFDIAGYREFPAKLLTPLFFFSMDLDRRLFGLDPRAFYLHHLLALSLCTAAFYGALRCWLSRLWAASGAWVFLIGPVVASLASSLFVRHYIETILLAALSVVAWAGALQRSPGVKAWRMVWLSAALYFAACMSKEIAVPLFAVLPLLPAPARRLVALQERFRLALPHAMAFLLYGLLRYTVLNTLLGGYGFTVDLPALAFELPGKMAAEFVAGQASPAAVLFALSLAAGVLSLLLPPRGWRTATLTGLALFLALLTVLPVSTRMEPRYAVSAWVVTAVALAAGCSKLAAENRARRRTAAAIAAVACAVGLWLNRQDWNVRFARAERMSAENRFILEMKEGDILRRPLTLAASLKELAWMRQAAYRRPPGGRWFQDDLFLCCHPGSLGSVWGYDPAVRRVVNITAQIPDLRTRHCSSIRAAAPLRAHFRFSGESLFWDLGPYRAGRYRFILDDGVEALEMPRSAGFMMGRLGRLPLRIAYESPAGWVTYSPELRLHLVEGWSTGWSRNGKARAGRGGIVRCQDGQPARAQGARR